jgi:hypothetical protein
MRDCFSFLCLSLVVPFDGTRKNLIAVFTFVFIVFSSLSIDSLQMHSRFLMFVWRKKLFLFATGIFMVLAILLWGFVYSSHVNHDDTNKGLSIKVTLRLNAFAARRI